jgi:hypothetical protein
MRRKPMIAKLAPLAVVLALALVGCLEIRPSDPDDKPAPVVPAPLGLTHVVHADSVYYTDGPQQSRPPDGTFKAGTKVKLVREAGSYSLVESAGGVAAYVSTGSLAPIAPAKK